MKNQIQNRFQRNLKHLESRNQKQNNNFLRRGKLQTEKIHKKVLKIIFLHLFFFIKIFQEDRNSLKFI